MIDTRQINDIVNRIAVNYNPDKIILFGSYAHGDYTDNSDLDLILIKETGIPKWIEKADHDLGTAQVTYLYIPKYRDIIAFHCQQALEF